MDLRALHKRLPEHVASPDVSRYLSDNYTVFDFETTTHSNGLAVYRENSTVMVAWFNGPGHPNPGMHVSWGGEFDHAQLVEDAEQAGFVVAHNAKFDLQWLHRCGAKIPSLLVWDTQLAEYVLGGNRWQWGALSLERCAKRRAWEGKEAVVSKMIKRGIPTQDIPKRWLEKYCIQDVALTERLFRNQLAYIQRAKPRLMPIVYTRCLVAPVLSMMEFTGMYLDPEKVVQRATDLERSYGELQQQMEAFTGGINTASTKQLAEFLYTTLKFKEPTDRYGKPDRTSSGRPKTDISTVLSLNASNAKQRKFLELYGSLNSVHTELTKYLRKFSDCCKDANGRLVAQFNQTNTQTHRLSSNGLDYRAQFQNFPRAYKPFFRSRHEGWLIGECDGAQLEFRVAAHLGRDEKAISDIVDEVDVHSFMAKTLTGAGQPTDRQGAKAHTFKPLFGGRSGTEAEQTYYRAFRDKYAGISDTQDRWITTVLEKGKLETEWGLQFYWPDTRMDRSGYVTNTTSICNYPVQSFATAEIIPVGLVYFWHAAKAANLELMVVNSIHDSIICEVPPNEVEAFHELSKYALINVPYWYLDKMYGVKLTAPLGAGVSIGPNWADEASKKSEQTYNANPAMYHKGA